MNNENAPEITPPRFDGHKRGNRVSLSSGLMVAIVLLCVFGGALFGFLAGMRVNAFLMNKSFLEKLAYDLPSGRRTGSLSSSSVEASDGNDSLKIDKVDSDLIVSHYDGNRQISYAMNDHNRFVSIPHGSGWVQFLHYYEKVKIDSAGMITLHPDRFVINCSLSELSRLSGTGTGKRTLRLRAAYGKKDSVDFRLTGLLVNYRSDSICDVSLSGYVFHK